MKKRLVVVGGQVVAIPKRVLAAALEEKRCSHPAGSQNPERDRCLACGSVKWDHHWFTAEELSEEFVERKMAEYRAHPTPLLERRPYKPETRPVRLRYDVLKSLPPSRPWFPTDKPWLFHRVKSYEET